MVDENRIWCRSWFPLALDMKTPDERREATHHIIDYFLATVKLSPVKITIKES
jgi:hypothetical protein